MAYTDHFRLTDTLIVHLDPTIAAMTDALMVSRYAGFLAVSSAAVLELSLKDIFKEFSYKKHQVLGNMCFTFFRRINGRITLKHIREDYLPMFGNKYLKRFDRKFSVLEDTHMRAHHISIKSSYSNLITWRHSFAHEGIIPNTASYQEVKDGYSSGKLIMDCLFKTMTR